MIVNQATIIKQISYNDTLFFRSKELMYLRLCSLGENDKDIAKFLNIPKRSLLKIKHQIEKKIKSKHWLEIIALAIEMNLLMVYDFAEEKIKNEGLKYTNEILLIANEKTPIPPHQLKHILNMFCDIQKEGFDTKHCALDECKVKILNERYKRGVIDDTFDGLEERNHLEIDKDHVFNILGVKNWIVALRKAAQLDLIDNLDREKSNAYRKLQTKRCASALNRLLFHKDISPIEKKQIIYDKLIRLNVDVELYKLFSGLDIYKV